MKTISIRSGLVMLACWALGSAAAYGQLLTESFKNTTAPGWTISGNAFLTAPSLDTAGSGWLQLTPNANGQAGAAISSTAIPSSNGVQVSFTFNDWGGGSSPADGICLAICDANNPPSVPGGGGQSLGYAQIVGITNGLVGGMLGIAFDEWGNFSSSYGGTHIGGTTNKNPFTVSVRGPGDGSSSGYITAPSGTPSFPNYNLLYTSATLSTNTLVPQPNAVTRPTAVGDLRQAVINFDMSGIASGHAYVTVQIYDGAGNLLAVPCNNVDVGAALVSYFGAGNVPTSFLMALTSGTGAARNTHEVQSFTVNTAVTSPNTALLSQDFKHIAAPGWTISGDSFLTAPSLDVDGSGWLQLTPNANNQSGAAISSLAIAASNGIQVAFDFNDWGGGSGPADGIVLAICDANNPPSGPGAGAGSLGYAQATNSASGMTGGMLGIAFDEWGNFSTTWGGHAGGTPTLNPFTVSIRGPGNGSTTLVTAPSGTPNFPNYDLLFLSSTLSTNTLVPQPNAVTRPTSSSDIRHAVVNFDMSDIANGHAYVGVQIYDGAGNLLATPCANQDVGAALIGYFGAGNVPASFLMALTSGTGAAKNTHEVRNLVVTQSTPMRTVTGAVNPPASGTVTGGGTYPVGSNAVLAASIGSGWLFTGWDDGSTNNPYTIVVPATNITYTANYTGYFFYTTNSGAITITGWNGAGGAVSVPSTINGLPVTTIASGAFTGCSNVTSVAVPASVTNIGTGAFSGCPSLTAINVDPANPNYESIGGVLYSKPPTTLLQYPEGLGGNFTIPNGVTTIGDGAFANNPGLTSVTVPASVTTIGNNVFANDPNLNVVYFQGNAPTFGTGVFTGDHATIQYQPGTSGWDETFTHTAAPLWTISGSAFLTAPSLDADGSGWLRLTPNALGQAGAAIGSTAIPSSNGVQVAFDFNDWGGGSSPADGIVLAICDANNPPSVPGAGGQSLGYAQTVGGVNGLVGGMLGIAFDEWGNFSSTAGGSHIGGTPGLNPFTVSIRGPGNGSNGGYITAPSGTPSFPNYNLLYTSATQSTNTLVPQPNAVTRPTSSSDIRHAVVNFDMSDIANGHAYVTVQIYDGAGNLLATPCANQDMGAALIGYFGAGNVPTSFLVALTSGTGAAMNNHEVRNLVVTQAIPMTTVTGAVNPLASGAVTGGGTYPAGSNVVLAASIGSGWLFTGWDDGSTNNPYTIVMPATNITYTANYTGYFFYTTNSGAITITGWNGAGGAVSIPSTINGLPVTAIAPNAFTGCSNVTSFAVPASVTSIGTGAFTGCPNLTAINVDPANPNYESIGGVLYSKPPTTLIKYPEGLGGDFTIPNGVTTIGDGAFANNPGLTSVTVPASVTSIGNNVFANDPNLNVVYFQGDAPSFGTGVFAGDNATVKYRAGTSGWGSTYAGATTGFWQGHAKLFFQDGRGQVATLLLETNGDILTSTLIGAASAGQLKAAGDIDGDGISDLLLQTAGGEVTIWFMNTNDTVKCWRYVGNTADWQVRACADYDGDGRTEIFFQNAAGDCAYWQTTLLGACTNAVLLGNTGEWQLKTAVDVDGDGKADLFWQRADGLVAAWFHNGAAINAVLLGNTGGWVLRAAADVDGDGCGDLAWQTADGKVGAWFMNSNGTPRAASYWWSAGGWKLKAASN